MTAPTSLRYEETRKENYPPTFHRRAGRPRAGGDGPGRKQGESCGFGRDQRQNSFCVQRFVRKPL